MGYVECGYCSSEQSVSAVNKKDPQKKAKKKKKEKENDNSNGKQSIC